MPISEVFIYELEDEKRDAQLDINISSCKRDNRIHKRFSWPEPVREEVTRDHPTSSPRIDHKRPPPKRPRHRPRPAPKPTHTTPSQPLEHMLQRRADAHEDEKPSGGAKLRPAPEAPNPKVVHDRGHRKGAEERAGPAEQRAARAPAKHDEGMPEELVPAEGPEVRDRGGRPGAVGERGPLPRGLPQDEAADERRQVVHHVDGCVYDYAGAEGEEGRESKAGDYAQRRVEDRIACWCVQGGSQVLHQVVGDVEHD